MLTKKQNLIETMKGGNPDRFVNQFEAFELVRPAFIANNPSPKRGEMNVKNLWGVIKSFPEGTPAAFPVHTPEAIVIKDITHWRDYVKAPNCVYDAKSWEPLIAQAEAVDRNEQFVLAFVSPGVFEQCHYLMEIQNCLMAFYDEPEKMHELIDFYTEWELKLAENICDYMKPDGVLHHDDWGTYRSTFFSPEMFEEFFLDSYIKIYGYYKSRGANLIVHHSDSYAATLVPYMIDMGINIWQGLTNTNDIPQLVKKYGKDITFMGGIDSADVDIENWNEELVQQKVDEICTACGTKYFIPSMGAHSTFPGVVEAASDAIDKCSKRMF